MLKLKVISLLSTVTHTTLPLFLHFFKFKETASRIHLRLHLPSFLPTCAIVTLDESVFVQEVVELHQIVLDIEELSLKILCHLLFVRQYSDVCYFLCFIIHLFVFTERLDLILVFFLGLC